MDALAVLDVDLAAGANLVRIGAQDVQQDRDIVRRQVPDDVDVGLQESQVGAGGIDVVDPAQLAAADQVAHDVDGRAASDCPASRRPTRMSRGRSWRGHDRGSRSLRAAPDVRRMREPVPRSRLSTR